MADIAGDTTTSATISVGTEITNAIEILGDHDWYRLQLTAGEKVSIAVNLDSMEDSYLYLRNASGTVIAENDDGGGGRGSRLVFTAPSTGTYFVDVAAWTPEPNDVPAGYTGTGSYTLSVNTYVTPPVGTLDDFAYQMTHGFFGGDYHHFDVTQGGTITVNFQGITDAGRAVALQALQQWTDIIGVNFVETAGDAQITFDDLDQGTGAFADTVSSNHITSSAIVNVAPYRLNLHTYMHEIGHALGIGHTSNSNAGTAGAVYPDDAIWRNDGAAISIMSYFDNGENAYYANLGFSNVAIMTPQVADIIAMGNLYGLSTITRTGDTTYGFNNNSGRDAFDAALHPNVSYTIFDSGGVDTLDYSGFASNQLINLNAEAFSNIGALVGNVVIARGTIIENARGGTGADTIVGNGANNALRGNGGADHLSGGGGNDALYGGGEADILNGGEGSDLYVIASASEHPSAEISDGGTAGFDELRFEAATAQMLTLYAADTGLERIRLGTAAAHGVDASALTNAIDLIGNSGDNRLFSTAFADRLIGGDGDDRLFGEGGNDRLYGEAGVDRLYGGTGNDIYIVRDATDYVYESAGEGADRVYSAISHALRSNVEELRLQGSAAINGYGGLDDNLIYGNSAANKLNGWGGDDNLYGEGGNDRLYGTDGDDRLFGELGNDRLDGGAGVDRMYGGGGDDIYIGRDTTDYAIENAGEGMDTVYSFETHILRDNVETLRLSGSAAINGWGNAGDDTIVGNGAANRLVGQGGDDRLFGGHGDDRLYGDEGNDRLDGGRGSDLLFGGSGSDDFLFRNGDFASDVPSGADRITDFSRAEGDRLHLSSVDANSAAGGNQAFAFIGTGDFTGTAGDLRYEQLSGSTYVSGDTNGDGVADFMIRLDGLHTLGSGDFVL